jgi:RND family efflux transporter MFP subunit
MSHDRTPDFVLENAANSSRGTGAVAAVAIGSLVLLGGAIGVRFVQATKKNAAVEEQRAATHAAAVAQAEKAPVVAVAKASPASWQPTVALEGSVSAGQEVDLGFKVSGRIDKLRVRLGDKVRVGATLATLEDREARAQVAAADAQARAAAAQLALAGDAKIRVESLVHAGAQAQANAVQSSEQHKLAAAQLDAAKAQGELARSYLESHVLRAPFDGTITRAPGGPGAVVNPMSPMNAVFHLVDARTLKLAGTIAERELGIVKPGDPVTVKVGDREVQGKLVAVVGATDPMTRRVPIEAVLENGKDAPILPGQYVRASIRGGAEVPVLALPATALRPGSQDEIFVVRDGKLLLRHVTFAVGEGGKLLVREGLDAREDVATSPAADWHEGDAVTAGVEGSR